MAHVLALCLNLHPLPLDREHGSPMPSHARKRAAKEPILQQTACADGSRLGEAHTLGCEAVS